MAHLLGTQSLGALAGSRQLLADVDISVEDSSRIGILGPNGAGKSTLLTMAELSPAMAYALSCLSKAIILTMMCA